MRRQNLAGQANIGLKEQRQIDEGDSDQHQDAAADGTTPEEHPSSCAIFALAPAHQTERHEDEQSNAGEADDQNDDLEQPELERNDEISEKRRLVHKNSRACGKHWVEDCSNKLIEL